MFRSKIELLKKRNRNVIRLKKIFHKVFSRYYNLKGYSQVSNFTTSDRYPLIFTYVSNYIQKTDIRLEILSYGCSTGLECFSLRNYFSSARIVGFDIKKTNIKKAKNLNTDSNIVFYDDFNKIKNKKFDLIFVMSVLCRWTQTQNVEDCSAIYTFARFNEQLHTLNDLLKVGGILIIYNSNFRFTDAAISRKYKKISILGFEESGFVTKFNIDNKVLIEQNYPYCLFLKTLE